MDADAAARLRRVVNRLARQFNSESTSEGLTPSQASVLGRIVGRGPLGISELGRMEGLNPTMLSRVIGKLEDAGLITRVPNPSDLRAALVQGTAAGRRVGARIRNRRTARLSAGIARLPPAQEQALIRALPALEALVEALQER